MATDIFGYTRNPKPKGVFSSSESLLTFSGNIAGYLVQNWDVSYQNNVLEIFELGSDDVYWVKGRPTGSGSVARIIGIQQVKMFPDSAWDACLGGATMEITASPGKCAGLTTKTLALSLGGVIVVQVGFSATVANTTINQAIAFRFATMELKE